MERAQGSVLFIFMFSGIQKMSAVNRSVDCLAIMM